MRIAIGVLYIIISPVPVVIESLLNVPDYVATALVILILIVVAGVLYGVVRSIAMMIMKLEE